MSNSGNDGSTYYHYNREERLARRQDAYERPSGGILRRNRSLTIILIDVLIVLMLFAIFRFFFFGREETPTVQGYAVSAELLETSQGSLGLVSISAPEEAPESSGIVTVRFAVLGSDQEDARSVEVKDLLPEGGERRRVSELFAGGPEEIRVVVEIDGETLELRASLPEEGSAP